MPALVRLSNTRINRYIGLSEDERTISNISPSGFALELRGGSIEILSGKEPGPIEGQKIEANQKAVVKLGTVQPYRYNVLTSIHPELLKLGTLGFPSIYEPDEEVELLLHVQASKKIDLDTLPWLVRLYTLD